MGGGTFNPEGPPLLDKDAEIASLRAELAGLAGIAQAYAEVQQRCERAEEMAAWAEREAERSDREAMEANAMLNQARLAEHTRQRIADYRERVQSAERELTATQRVRDIWREAYKDLDDAVQGLNSGDLYKGELYLARFEIAETLKRGGIS